MLRCWATDAAARRGSRRAQGSVALRATQRLALRYLKAWRRAAEDERMRQRLAKSAHFWNLCP